MVEGKSFGKYPRFPIFNSKPTKRDYQFIIDNFKNKLVGWKIKHLTMAGRTALIKVTLNSMPNHIMQFISLLSHIITKLERYQKNFLWGTTVQKNDYILLNRIQ